MSAWYVFSAMGFYPVNPVEGKYQLGAPLFDKITLSTGPEKKFVITANKESDRHIYVQEVYLNEKKLDRTWITHEEIMNGGELEFVLTSEIPQKQKIKNRSKEMKNIGVILAGGSGRRLGSELPKQFIVIAGKTVLAHTLHTFEKHEHIDEIIIV